VGRRRRWASRRRGYRRVRRRQSVRLGRSARKEDRRHPKKEGGIQKRKEEAGRQGRSTRMLVAAVAAVAAAVAAVVAAVVAAAHIPPHIVHFGLRLFGRFRPLRPSPVRPVRPVPFGCVSARHCPPLRSLPSPPGTDLPPPFPPPFPSPSLHLVHLHFAVMASVPRGPHAQLGPLSSVPRQRCLLSDLNLSDLNIRSRLRSPATFLSPRAVAGTQPLPLPPPPAHCWYGYGGGAPPYWP